MENKSIHNHPLKKFEVEGQKVVAILIEASGTKQDELWRLQKVSMKRGGSWKGNSHAQQRKTFSLVSRVGAWGLCFALGFGEL